MPTPFVTVILPIRNEERRIARCLEAVQAQDIPVQGYEILVVDGMSRDRTREIVSDLAAQDDRIRLLDNPQGIVPTALNIGIRAARGDVIIRVDGHTEVAPDYVRRCLDALEESKAENVGGLMHAVGETYMARAIAIATSSPFGVGSARFHYAGEPGWVDTVYLGAFRRQVFDRVGMFDEELVRNQDDEFNFRLSRAGGRIWLDPRIRSTYYSRATLPALWKQYLEYGLWKVRVIVKHGRPASWRHLVPAVFVGALAAAAVTSLLALNPLWVLGIAVPYLAVSLAASIWMGARAGWQYAPVLPLVFAVLHVAYGVGFLWGVLRLPEYHRRRRPDPAR